MTSTSLLLLGLLQELSTPVREESIENNEVTRATKAIQEEISCCIIIGRRMKRELRRLEGVSDQSARNQMYDDTMEHLPDGLLHNIYLNRDKTAVLTSL
ncbi:hypothetical protein GLOIN_2v1785376 [Rhizophagus irregularis DAOM 181602=DAOM 197198]|nr:hypothetical protein GLOIN_2v1785376 [Rhizophagus irregularis DAOM 181602=DAOM 197198]